MSDGAFSDARKIDTFPDIESLVSRNDGSEQFLAFIERSAKRYVHPIYGDYYDPSNELNGNPTWLKPTTYFGRVEKCFNGRKPPIENGRILDLGCSIGYTTQELALLYPTCEVVGIDCQEDVLRNTRNYPKIDRTSYVCGNGYDLDSVFGDVTFDMIVLMNNIWHISHSCSDAFLEDVLSNIKRHVSDHGYLVISTDLAMMVFQKKIESFDLWGVKSADVKLDLLQKKGTAYRLASLIDSSCVDRLN